MNEAQLVAKMYALYSTTYLIHMSDATEASLLNMQLRTLTGKMYLDYTHEQVLTLIAEAALLID